MTQKQVNMLALLYLNRKRNFFDKKPKHLLNSPMATNCKT